MGGLQPEGGQHVGTRGKFDVCSFSQEKTKALASTHRLNRLFRSAHDILQEYIRSIGGKPAVPERGGKKRGRPSEGNGNTPDTAKKPAKKGRVSQNATKANSPTDTPSGDKPGDWKPPKGSWEGKVQGVDTIEQADDGELQVYLMWNDGKKSKHPIKVCYDRCPQTVSTLRTSRCRVSSN